MYSLPVLRLDDIATTWLSLLFTVGLCQHASLQCAEHGSPSFLRRRRDSSTHKVASAANAPGSVITSAVSSIVVLGSHLLGVVVLVGAICIVFSSYSANSVDD